MGRLDIGIELIYDSFARGQAGISIRPYTRHTVTYLDHRSTTSFGFRTSKSGFERAVGLVGGQFSSTKLQVERVAASSGPRVVRWIP